MSLTYRQLASRLTRLREQVDQAANESPDEGGIGPDIAECATMLQALAERAESLRERDPLTDTQGRVLAFIRTHIKQHGTAPTRQEIADALGFGSPNAAQQHVVTLEERGFLTRTGGGAREMRLTKRTAL